VETSRVQEHLVFTMNKKQKNEQIHILYLHGGAYVESFVKPHWDFLFVLMQNLDCTITAPDYPLAPAHTYKHSFAMVSEVYKELIKTIHPKKIILMGDSSGGGFALALAQLMRNEKVSQPSQIILLSPWLDIGLTNPAIKDVELSDYFLGVEGLKMAGKAYAGGKRPDYYLLSPVYGTLEGLSKISIFIGSREILVADARKLKAQANEKGVELNYFEYPGMFHAWMLLNLPESKKAKQQIIDLIRSE
jgi:acetyl esterase/lipase